MKLQDAISCCHVRSAIYRKSTPERRYWKNTSKPFADIPETDRRANDWKEYDPSDDESVSSRMA
jgi:hypothetical protein